MGWKEKIIAQEARNPRVVSLAQTEEKSILFSAAAETTLHFLSVRLHWPAPCLAREHWSMAQRLFSLTRWRASQLLKSLQDLVLCAESCAQRWFLSQGGREWGTEREKSWLAMVESRTCHYLNVFTSIHFCICFNLITFKDKKVTKDHSIALNSERL